jgi:hypothetical protein
MSRGPTVEAEVGDQKIAAENSEQLNLGKEASITWDHPCCPIHRKYYTYACVFLDNRKDYNLVIDTLIPCYMWVVHLGILASA